MRLVTVIGPLATEQEARDTCSVLGDKNHSVYSRAIHDSDGFETDNREWYVERDLDIVPNILFGMSWDEIRGKQSKD